MVLTRSLFEITKPFKFVEIPYREVNEIKPHFLKKFHKFTDDGFRVKITWKTSEVQNHWNTFETMSNTVLHGLLFQMLQKCYDQEELRSIILHYGNLALTNKRTLKDLFYSKMVRHYQISFMYLGMYIFTWKTQEVFSSLLIFIDSLSGIFLFGVNNRKTRTKLVIKTPERRL